MLHLFDDLWLDKIIPKNNDEGRAIYGNLENKSALARTLQLFTDRPNNDRRSREHRTFLYDVADLWLETVTKFFPRTMFDGLSWKF